LAHHGVLFLDELPEFQPQVLDSLRQPLEAGEILIAWANHRVTYPARFQLVAAMNPCRCGQATEPGYVCRRQPNERCIAQYQARLSGPLLDRIDLSIDVPAVTAADLILPPPVEGSAEVAARVARARERQAKRYAALNLEGVTTNAACPPALLEEVARPRRPGSHPRCRQCHAPVRPRLSSCAEGGAYTRQSRRGRSRPAHSHRRSLVLPRPCGPAPGGRIGGIMDVSCLLVEAHTALDIFHRDIYVFCHKTV
jgi:magnesium chelatase family protein